MFPFLIFYQQFKNVKLFLPHRPYGKQAWFGPWTGICQSWVQVIEYILTHLDFFSEFSNNFLLKPTIFSVFVILKVSVPFDTCCDPSLFQNSPSSHVDMIKCKCGFTRNMMRESNMMTSHGRKVMVLTLSVCTWALWPFRTEYGNLCGRNTPFHRWAGQDELEMGWDEWDGW